MEEYRGRRKKGYQTPTGMHDVLPQDQRYFQKIYNICENIVSFYGFQKIETPIVETAELFSKGIGLATDIVEKQMYVFRTKGGDWLALRPEGTASVVRAFIEHGMQSLPKPVKLWYFGPFFRYEHPQAGRFRQFHQFGFEAFGEKSPVMDAQIVQVFYNILKELRFDKLVVEVNNIGDSQCRPYYKKLLVSYLKYRLGGFCAVCRQRAKENPLRIFDCKEEKCQRIKAQAPQIIDHLCEECHNHFREFLEFLDELELPYNLNPYLVRGLDYYTKTVFEIFSTSTENFNSSQQDSEYPPKLYTKEDGGSAETPLKLSEEGEKGYTSKDALVGGGRYDNLCKILGGEPTPACGGAAGIERIVKAMKQRTPKLPQPQLPKVFMAQLGNLAKRKSLKLFEEFRKNRISVADSFGRDDLKAQLKASDRIGVQLTLILGQKEVLEGTIIIKDMKTGRQETVKLEKIIKEVKKRLKKA
ncbi:histidine--tRNA ligase [Patescibacteria group bacterium]|nr:histidine--tRNA ligase [Patescibacteria group bacterium]